jgi:hypothetical protein
MSLNAPETLRDLRVRQATNMDAVLWWPCPASTTVQVIPTSGHRDALVSGTARLGLDPSLQVELSAALEDTLSSQMSPSIPIPKGTSTPVKTSITHPLKFVLARHEGTLAHHCSKRSISTIIPPELLSAISSHLLTNPRPSPIIFHIPDSYTLHRITGNAQLIPSMNPISLVAARKVHSRLSTRTSPPIPIHSSPSAPIAHAPPLPISSNQPKLSIAEALHVAMDTRLTTSTHPLNVSYSSPPILTKLPPPPILKQSIQVRSLSDNSVSHSYVSLPQSSSGQRGTSAPPKALFPSVLDLLQPEQ